MSSAAPSNAVPLSRYGCDNIYELTRLREISAPSTPSAAATEGWEYESVTQTLELLGNPRKIAYGGCALALSGVAAYRSLDGKDYAPYSMSAQYLGPTAADQPVRLHVRTLRDTRTFATRSILVTQQQPDGSRRGTLAATIDFVAPQEADSPQTLLRYSVKPKQRDLPAPESLPTRDEKLQQLAQNGKLSPDKLKEFKVTFSPMGKYFDHRALPATPLGQKLNGILSDAPSTQDDRHITEMVSGDWFKSANNLPELVQKADPANKVTLRALNLATTLFYLDGSMAFLPLIHTRGLWFPDTSASSSLDFVARWHTDDFDPSQWHVREIQTLHGAHARTYTEARIFDRSGELVITTSQQGVMRASKERTEQKARGSFSSKL